MKDKAFEEQLRNGLAKGMAMERLERLSIIAVDDDNSNACIHYLMFHSLSNQGLVKFTNSLFFYLKLKRAMKGISDDPTMTVFVNYGSQINQYGKRGMVPQFKFDGSRFLPL